MGYTLFKLFLAAVLIAFAGVVFFLVLVGLSILEVKYFHPWKHHRNTAAAEVTNDAIWSEELATTYRVEAVVSVAGKAKKSSLDIQCARKVSTWNGGIKGLTVRDTQKNFSSTYIRIP
ncbi:MAG: hypothetical protein WBB85_08370, partial [Albidovulum sp.]|uniref:hypothetical protein n=1 Tax=Albidovulum sp. TaxID=1872424 RepID=UPI003CAD6626